MYKNLLTCLFALLLTTPILFAQEYTVEIEEEQKANRLFLNAVNKNLVDLDVAIKVEGTGFRQRKGIPRKVRVPATSKVNLISLIVERGQQAMYTYTLDVTDSLSRRVIRKEFEKIKIDPKLPITIYIPENCTNCDSIIAPLNETPYKYKAYKISEDENVKNQLERAFANSSRPLETIDTAIITLGGSMYLYLTTFEEMMAKLNEEDEEKTEE
ncbi:MAG: hypothetical protein HKN48_13505 [Flavobacteriaceae bacterium]|nr:hypothetical protein [Flavobacteriaceae bacterium]